MVNLREKYKDCRVRHCPHLYAVAQMKKTLSTISKNFRHGGHNR
jgi:hypothetical protein